MTITRPAPVQCPKCSAPLWVDWSDNFTRALFVGCTHCHWNINLEDIRLARCRDRIRHSPTVQHRPTPDARTPRVHPPRMAKPQQPEVPVTPTPQPA